MAGGIAPAQAAINYLVIAPSQIAGNYYGMSLSIAASCPAGYFIHRYGLDDLNVWWQATGDKTVGNTVGNSSLNLTVCIPGVPSSINVTPSERVFGGSAYAITTTLTLTSANSPQIIAPYASATAFGGGWGSGIHLVLPDGYNIIIQHANGTWDAYAATMSNRFLPSVAPNYFLYTTQNNDPWFGIYQDYTYFTYSDWTYSGLSGHAPCYGYFIGY